MRRSDRSQEEDQALIDRFPRVLSDPSCSLVPSVGWMQILERLFEELERCNPVPQLAYAKTKFARLRLVLRDTSDPSVAQLVKRAEIEAAFSCEACGAPGETVQVDGGWHVVLCQQHQTELRREGRKVQLPRADQV